MFSNEQNRENATWSWQKGKTGVGGKIAKF